MTDSTTTRAAFAALSDEAIGIYAEISGRGDVFRDYTRTKAIAEMDYRSALELSTDVDADVPVLRAARHSTISAARETLISALLSESAQS